MPAKTLIPSQTAAVTVVVYHSLTLEDVPATLAAKGLAGSEAIPVLITTDNGLTNQAAQQNGAAVELTVTDNNLKIDSPITIGVTKPTTAGATEVTIAFQRQV